MQDNTPQHFKKIQPNLQKAFKKHAMSSGWPEDIVKQIKVEIKDNKLYLNYKASLKEHIDNLEYGNKQDKPKPAIRKFTANIGKEVSDAAADKILDVLKSVL